MKEKKQSQEVQINFDFGAEPILYTDSIFITSNEDGIIINFSQPQAIPTQQKVVARIGMSREHAKKFIQKISNLFAITENNKQIGQKSQN